MADGGDFPGILLKAHEMCTEDEWSGFTLFFAKIEHNEVVRVWDVFADRMVRAIEQTNRNIMATDEFSDAAKKSFVELDKDIVVLYTKEIEKWCAEFLVGRFRGEW